jgi:hypothetical protein
MYTNIPTVPALEIVGKYLGAHCHPKLAEALIDTLTILMENNIVRHRLEANFGNCYGYLANTSMGNTLLCHPRSLLCREVEGVPYPFGSDSLTMVYASGNSTPTPPPIMHSGLSSRPISKLFIFHELERESFTHFI